LSADVQRQINAICLQFEQSCQAGPPWPLLAGAEASPRSDLLSELLALELYYLAPDLAALLAEQFQRILERLDDPADPDLRKIALWKMSGHSSADIAEQLGCSVPTVRRRLRLIRTLFKNP
jgi:DNA-directed RNA polymerase specialized sigma24 family protein